MLNLTTITETPSELIRNRSKLMWATRYDSGRHTISYKVVPHSAAFGHKGKDKRIVLFDLKRGTADCLSLETGEVCEANSFGRLCSHVYAAHRSIEAASKRQGKVAA
jgi:hypothetical protein